MLSRAVLWRCIVLARGLGGEGAVLRALGTVVSVLSKPAASDPLLSKTSFLYGAWCRMAEWCCFPPDVGEAGLSERGRSGIKIGFTLSRTALGLFIDLAGLSEGVSPGAGAGGILGPS